MALRANRGRLRLVEPPPPAPEAAPLATEGARPATVPPSSGVHAPTNDAPQAVPAVPARAPQPSSPGGLAEASPIPDAAPPFKAAANRAQLALLTDAQLVALGCKGEGGALEILYRRHAAFAIHLAARIEGSSRDVEDIAHDAFVRAFERLPDLSDRSAFRSWLGSIVVHAVRSRMRRHRLMSLLGLKTAEPVDLDALASPDASPHVRAQLAQIYALLRTLPTDERIAWVLRSVEGHDLDTVARLTGCSLATVKRRITRAQRFLDEHFVDPDTQNDPGHDFPHPLAPGKPVTMGETPKPPAQPGSAPQAAGSSLSSPASHPEEVPS